MSGEKLKDIFKDDVLAAVIMAEEVSNLSKQNVSVEVKSEKKYKTLVLKDNIKNLYRSLTFLNVKGEGRIREFSLATSSPNYYLEVVIDNRLLYSDRFNGLEKLSSYTSNLDAFISDTSEYVLRIGELNFLESAKIKLNPDEPMSVFYIITYDINEGG